MRFLDTAIDEADPAVIFYTSGTTGKPKGAISTHRGMVANLQNTMFNTVAGRWPTPTRHRPAAIAAHHGLAVHLTAVPRVGLPLDARRRHARRASSW